MHNFGQSFPRHNFPRRPPRHHAQFPGSNPMQNNHVRWSQQQYNNKEEHWCETCDRGFPSLDLLEKHKQQHQKCNIDGCQFVAHPKVITKHIQMQHSTGLYKQIAKLVNPEEIQRWREERKKKYPTKENIDKKVAEMKEKVDRGEKMGLHRDRRNKFNKTESGIKRKSNESYEQRHPQKSKPRPKSKPINKKPRNEPPQAEEKSRLIPFAGIQLIAMESDDEEKYEKLNYDFLIEDDEGEAPVNKHNETEDTNKPILCGALSSLVCEYGSSDDETNDVKKASDNSVLISQKSIPGSTNNKPGNKLEITLKQNDRDSDNDSGPEEVKVIKDDVQHNENLNIVFAAEKGKDKHVIAKKKFAPMNHQKNFRRPKPKLPSTLLQKLLSKEVQHERNIILQCIRYIKKQNYFEN